MLNEAQRSEASMRWIPRYARNDTVGFVMLNEAKHPYWIPRLRSE